ncbi:NUDIX domain-containing protein [Microbacterium sp. W1N]|uniref:NUDIX hydrolase n=1 Tax=Microbacterium festucae TaxID=2977531 RepID=UPI0021C13726|nr:NUDIX domain-containing protein [Microbacterium festucae]MCT9819181.1 NUDIX domain-containing protein [Microbacterium festucae]
MSSARFSVVPASYVFLMRGSQVLLQRRQNTGYMDGMWVAGAAGHIEPGETAVTAARREAREELGIDVAASSLRPVTVMQRTDGSDAPREQRVDWFFTAEEWAGEPTIMEPQKCAEIAWFDLTGLPAEIPDYERLVLDGLASGRLDLLTSVGFSA